MSECPQYLQHKTMHQIFRSRNALFKHKSWGGVVGFLEELSNHNSCWPVALENHVLTSLVVSEDLGSQSEKDCVCLSLSGTYYLGLNLTEFTSMIPVWRPRQSVFPWTWYKGSQQWLKRLVVNHVEVLDPRVDNVGAQQNSRFLGLAWGDTILFQRMKDNSTSFWNSPHKIQQRTLPLSPVSSARKIQIFLSVLVDEEILEEEVILDFMDEIHLTKSWGLHCRTELIVLGSF